MREKVYFEFMYCDAVMSVEWQWCTDDGVDARRPCYQKKTNRNKGKLYVL